MSVKLKSIPKNKRLSTTKCEDGDRICIVHNFNHKDDSELKPITEKRWNKIQEIKRIRNEAEDESDKKTNICSNIPNELDLSSHGFHDYCYNAFINLKVIKRKSMSIHTEEEPSGSNPKRRATATESSNILFPKECFFCQKKTKWNYGAKKRRDPLVKCQTKTAEESIKEAVSSKDDQHLKVKVQNVDLVARELWYHETCRKEYTRKPSRNILTCSSEEEKAKFEERKMYQAGVENAHAKAFNHICEYVEETVIQRAHVARMALLMQKYIMYMKSNFPEHYNENYKADKLKRKLILFFGTKIQFWQRYEGSGDLIYSDDVPTGQAVGVAFENATTDEQCVVEAALVLRKAVLNGFQDARKMAWPPSMEDLKKSDQCYPKLITTFLSHLYSKQGKAKSESCKRRIDATAQDICFNITKGRWKMQKHILLGMAVRHMTGCTKLIGFLNRYGHTVSNSFLLELETAICDSIHNFSLTLPPTIMRNNNDITHFCWDNFDVIEDTPSGAGTTHDTHGIVIQEIIDAPYIPEETPEIERSKKRSIKFTPQQLEPCFINPKTVTPNVSTNCVKSEKEIPASVHVCNFQWFLTRCELNEDGESVPSWSGWLTKHCEGSNILSVVDYMENLNHPITEYSTVQQVIKISQKGSRDVQQEYTFITFDLAVAKMGYSLVWQHQVLFNDVIIHLRVFHIIYNYLKAVGKLLVGSGFEEVVVDSKICASGSIDGVLKGKHYNRSLMVHKTVLEALERLLFSAFRKTVDIDTLLKRAKEEMKNVQACGEGSAVQALVEEYFKFKQDVRRGKFGKTAQFWIQYTDLIWNIMYLLRATKTNDLDLHITSLENICPIFFSMDHQNYSRYLTCYILLLLNLDISHPGAKDLLKEKGFSVCRSTVPASRVAVDQTIEQTINKSAKGKGGIIGFSKNQAAYQRWCITRHKRAAFVALLQEQIDIDNSENPHKDNQKSQMKISEKNVRSIIQSFKSLANPFEMNLDSPLISLSSGLQASQEVEHDLLTVQEIGRNQYEMFITDRLVNKTTSFHAPIKRNRIKNLGSLSKTAILKTRTKTESPEKYFWSTPDAF